MIMRENGAGEQSLGTIWRYGMTTPEPRLDGKLSPPPPPMNEYSFI